MVDDILYVIGGSTKDDIGDWYSSAEIIATNEQYVPKDYKNEQSIISSNNTLVKIMLMLTISIITLVGLFFFFKNKKSYHNS